jgi:endonuclease-8
VPEGDTIFRVAEVLRPMLVGKRLVEAWCRDTRAELKGRAVEAVEAVGKHLLVTLEGGIVLRSHLGLHGSWHRYDPGERWKRPRHQAGILLATAEDVLVCFGPQQVELIRARDVPRHRVLSALGPDLCLPEVDWDEVLARARAAPQSAGDLLLDQRVASGIGNVYRNDVLFLERIHPATPSEELDDEVILRLFRLCHELLRLNLGPGARDTTRGAVPSRTWVYGRGGRPCFRCGTRIEKALQGTRARVTTWCPTCQKEP